MAIIKLELIGRRNQREDATFRPYSQLQDTLSWYTDWFPQMFDLSGQRLYEDSHWRVPDIWDKFDGSNKCEVVILEAAGQIQAYVVINFDHKDINGKSSTYIPFLASAPWNRKATVSSHRKYKHIGQIIVAVASLKAYKNNNKPELELHSLPSAENFYRKLNMVETGRVKNRMKEFRLEKAQAFDLIRFLIPMIKKICVK